MLVVSPILLPADTPILWAPPWVDRTPPEPEPGPTYIRWFGRHGCSPDDFYRRLARASGRPPADEIIVPS